MATIFLFIAPTEIKNTTLIDENVDEKLIRTVIDEAQKMHIEPILGTGLYDQLKTQGAAGTLTALNTTLLSTYIQPALKYWVLYEGIDVLTYKFMNKAVVKRGSENAAAIDLDELRRLMDRFMDKAEYFSERITKYLLQNTSSYPLYLNPGNGLDIINPNNTNYSTGIYLGGTDCCNEFP